MKILLLLFALILSGCAIGRTPGPEVIITLGPNYPSCNGDTRSRGLRYNEATGSYSHYTQNWRKYHEERGDKWDKIVVRYAGDPTRNCALYYQAQNDDPSRAWDWEDYTSVVPGMCLSDPACKGDTSGPRRGLGTTYRERSNGRLTGRTWRAD